MSSLQNRLGKFKIHRDLLMSEENESLLKLFANMIIVRAEYMFVSNSVEYEAMSPLFREVNTGESAPDYDIVCQSVYDDNGNAVDLLFEAKEL